MRVINDNIYNNHWIYLDDNDVPLLLPCLYSRYTYSNGLSLVHSKTLNREAKDYEFCFEEIEISDDAQYVRVQQLACFLKWVEDYDHPLVTLDNHTALPSEYINEYVNDHLICSMEKSEIVVNRATMALNSYYNWLSFFFDNPLKKIFVFSENRQIARSNNKAKLIVKYLLPATRELLYRHAGTLLEEIVLRNGGELGCRTKENQGFYLSDYRADGKIQTGLLSLFNELITEQNKEEFQYHLPSINTKYGKARTLYIQRSHLELMKRYYDLERPQSDSNHLLISNSRNSSRGHVIAVNYGTKLFSRIAEKVRQKIQDNPEVYSGYQDINAANTYHHLRHSFGTDVFYEGCIKAGKNAESITTESRVYIETARRMGHTVAGRNANETTKVYIHAVGQREALLKEVANG
ncbi:site-specific integrase [Photobacterium leiognathi]|uniref:site-specific integrase n=1 Tax=Photobacterium leiognathi TaxID=553611 RepID=UPI002982B1D9|nr:site-specific integrase [Photobacterium leiognathi]